MGKLIELVLTAALVFLVVNCLFMLCWNYVASDFGLPNLTFGKSLCVMVVVNILLQNVKLVKKD